MSTEPTTKKYTIEIMVEVETAEHLGYSTTKMVQSVIRDSLAEFISHRSTVDEYIARRYPETDDYAWMDREKKAKQVIARKFIAKDMLRKVHVTPHDLI